MKKNDKTMTHVYVAEQCGARKTMEDTHIIDLQFLVKEKDGVDAALFAIFDGHAGSIVSTFLRDHYAQELKSCLYKTPLFKIEQAFKQSFYNCNEQLEKFLQYREISSGGSTAVVALIVEKKFLFVANCGDSEAIVNNQGTAFCQTQKHHPYNNLEYARVKNAGGFVYRRRVDGMLALSRSFGDFNFKGVIVDPFVTANVLTSGNTLILACDGLWDVFSHQQAADFVRKLESNDNLALELVKNAIHVRKTRDNVSVIVVQIRNTFGPITLVQNVPEVTYCCQTCRIRFKETEFSKNQLKKPNGNRKCKVCVRDETKKE